MMEIQCPFSINFETLPPTGTFADYVLKKVQKHGKAIALVDSDTKKQWRFCDIEPIIDNAIKKLKQSGLEKGNKIAFSLNNCPQIILLQLAAAKMGVPCTGINPYGNVDELWHQIDLCEASHVFTEMQFVMKYEEVKKKATARGSLSKIRHVRLLEDYVSETVQRQPSLTGSVATVARLTKQASVTGNPGNKMLASKGANKFKDLARRTSNAKEAAKDKPAADGGTPSKGGKTKLKKSDSRTVISPASSTTTMTHDGSDGGENEEAQRPESDQKMGGPAGFCPSFLMFFSSGTTGLPKPIEISHSSFAINLQQLSAPYLRPPKKNERYLAQIPFHHIYGTQISYLALNSGATVITVKSSEADVYCEAIQEYKITCIHATPAIVMMLAYDLAVDDFDMSSIQTFTCAGAPLDPLMAQQAAERLELKDLRQLYGATEGLACTASFFGCTKIDSIGVPLPGVQIKIVHTDKRNIVEPGIPGELMIKGPQISVGNNNGPIINSPRYYKNPKATGELFDKEGWLKSGDMAYYDTEGYIYMVDRIKDVIKHKGIQTSPTEVEILLRTHPGVADCAVIGRPEAISGDVPAAFIVKAEDMQHVQPSDIRDHVKGKITGFKELKGGIFFVTEIPRTVSGKVMRRNLKNFWERDRTGKKAGLQSNGSSDSPSVKKSGKKK